MLETRRANCGVAIALLTSKVNLADIQPENQQNVQKTCFWQKAPRVNGLIKHSFFYYVKQVDSHCWVTVCSVKDHRKCQNGVRKSVEHSAIASCITFLFSPILM